MRASGLVEADVHSDAAAKESRDAAVRAIEELVGDEKIERREILAKRADGADRNQTLDSEHFHDVNIGTIVDLTRREAMAAAVAGQECHAAASGGGGDDGIRGIAEGSLHVDLARAREIRHMVQAAAADDADLDG